MPTYRECNETAERLRKQAAGMLKLADFIEKKGVKMPDIPYVYDYSSYDVYLTQSDSRKNEETGKWESHFNEFETSLRLQKFIKAIGSCEKQYSDDRLIVTKTFGDAIRLRGTVKRELVCEKKVIEKVWHEPHTSEGYYEEKVEWECNTPSLLGLVKGA